jgi:hypothetical protein
MNAENFKNTFLKDQFFVKENAEYFEIFKNTQFFEMESSKLSRYSADMC